jgi:Na+-transporting NADH:ubiquinone oxidoreductase subunit NqrF
VYVCGPPQMNKEIPENLMDLGVLEKNIILI